MSICGRVSGDHLHFGWDNSLKPVLTVDPGEEVEIELVEASNRQIGPDSTREAVAKLDFGQINPVTGPIFINGATPADTLTVEILGFEPSGWGWTAIIPGFGLLAEDFSKPFLQISKYTEDGVDYTPEICLPYRPFPGTIGVTTAASGIQSVVFPRQSGGNMDIKNLTPGSKLFLPIQVDGALFSVGDGHAAQGDGEVCGTAIETPLKLRVRFQLLKGMKPPYPQLETVTTPPTAPVKSYVSAGVSPDLMTAAKDAIKYMIDYLGREYKLAPEFAYTLCSVAVDLRLSELVDAPNWIVTAHLDRSIFI